MTNSTKGFSLILFRALFVLVIFYSQKNALAQQSADHNIQSVFWKIYTKNSNKVSYLLGTVHAFSKSWVDSFPSIYNLVEKSDKFICESSSYTRSDSLTASFLDSISTEDTAKTAAELFGKDTSVVDDYFIQYGWAQKPSELFEKSDRPSYQVTLLSQMYFTLTYKLLNYAHVLADGPDIDDVLWSFAKSRQKEIINLDNAQGLSKIDFLDQSTFATPIIKMVKMLNGINKSKTVDLQALQEYLKWANLYKQGLLDIREGKQISKLDLVQVNERNLQWIPSLRYQLEHHNCFIAVGMGHLFGRQGIIPLLRKQGFNIEPVYLKKGNK